VHIKNILKNLSHTTSVWLALHWHLHCIVICCGYVYYFVKVRVDCYFLFLFSHLACHDAWSTGVFLVVLSSRLAVFIVLPMLICCFCVWICQRIDCFGTSRDWLFIFIYYWEEYLLLSVAFCSSRPSPESKIIVSAFCSSI